MLLRGDDGVLHECKECLRLWREYGEATSEAVRLESKLRFAALQGDHHLIQSLTQDVEQAGEKRRAAREAIRIHEGTHSPAPQVR